MVLSAPIFAASKPTLVSGGVVAHLLLLLAVFVAGALVVRGAVDATGAVAATASLGAVSRRGYDLVQPDDLENDVPLRLGQRPHHGVLRSALGQLLGALRGDNDIVGGERLRGVAPALQRLPPETEHQTRRAVGISPGLRIAMKRARSYL